jgi:hypothetical protein
MIRLHGGQPVLCSAAARETRTGNNTDDNDEDDDDDDLVLVAASTRDSTRTFRVTQVRTQCARVCVETSRLCSTEW